MLDYGSGNLYSVARAFALAGARVAVTGSSREALAQDALVVPGVGAFAACMAGLRSVGVVDLILEWISRERPLMGICVGHQVLFRTGTEHGVITDGLGVFGTDVIGLPAARLPHMGWNTVQVPPQSRLFRGVEGQRFYFVHSYAAQAGPQDACVTTATHEDISFVAAVERDGLCSTQFHPEKSGAAGAGLIRNWLGDLG